MSKTRFHKLVAVGAAGVALAVGSLAISTLSPFGLAGAQDANAPEPEAATADSGGSTAESDRKADNDCDGKRERRDGLKKGRAGRLAAVAEALDMAPDAVAEALRSGQSVADLAGNRVDEVIAALVQDAIEQVQAKVDDGLIDQAKADEMIAALEEKVTAFVNGERPDGIDNGRKGHRGRGFKAGANAEKTAA